MHLYFVTNIPGVKQPWVYFSRDFFFFSFILIRSLLAEKPVLLVSPRVTSDHQSPPVLARDCVLYWKHQSRQENQTNHSPASKLNSVYLTLLTYAIFILKRSHYL